MLRASTTSSAAVGRRITLRSADFAVKQSRRSCVRAAAALEAVQLATTATPIADLASISGGIRASLTPAAEYFNTLGVPDWLVHWGHPGNMFVVLSAMGGYGSYLGWQIRLSDDGEVVAKAKDSHAPLMVGMFVFFALGASGGMMSLIMQGQPILASGHVKTGLAGLGLLSLQAMLPLLFSEGQGVRTAHAYLGSAIMLLFAVHAALGLQLGLSI